LIVRRVEVEGGFLDGLNLQLGPGLVAVIGPRGTGKTSLVELIRFGMDAGRITATPDPYEQARAVLDAGQVTLTVDVDGEDVQVVRGPLDVMPRGLELLNDRPPLILAQNEIEELGEDRVGQLSLIDEFRPRRGVDEAEEIRLQTVIREATAAIREIRGELAEVSDRLAQLGDPIAAQEEIKTLESRLNAGAEQTKPLRAQLDELTSALSDTKITTDLLRRNVESVKRWQSELLTVTAREPQIYPIPNSVAQHNGLEERLAEARASLDSAVSSLGRGLAGIELALSTAAERETSIESKSREIRRQLDAIEEGTGATARSLSDLRQREALASSLRDLIAQREAFLLSKAEARRVLLEQLDGLRERRFQERAEVVEMLNSTLAPKISLTLTRSGNFAPYSELLVALLRGSRLQYNTLAPTIASQVESEELAQIVESGDASSLAAALGIDADRAARVVGHLSTGGTEDLFTVGVDDAVEIRLLDGDQYKSSAELSTGQRCTAILPILLAQPNRTLIIDQPEDHLDNAFVVDTVIKALRTRGANSQAIFTTHNANIPVLGDARRVVALDSNGRRGFEKHSGPLDDERIVTLIKDVMEGGEEAFRRRASFYASHSSA
jgi:ABC-type Mn2+/Zn2+ transport system ATPase subunit